MKEIPSNRLTSLSEELRMDGTIRLFYDHCMLPKINFGRAIELCGGIETYNKVCEALLCGIIPAKNGFQVIHALIAVLKG